MHKGTQGGLKLNFFLSPDTLGDWAHKNFYKNKVILVELGHECWLPYSMTKSLINISTGEVFVLILKL